MTKTKIKGMINKALARLTGYKIVQDDWTEGRYRDRLAPFIEEKAGSATGDVLDIGSGTWTWVQERFKGQCALTTFDQTKTPNIDVVGDLHELGAYFPKKKFDAVFCFETLEHVKNPFAAMDQIRQILKPGGLFVGSAPFRHELHGEEYGDYWRMTRQGWQVLLSGFTDIEIVPLGDPLIPHHYMVSARKK